MESSRKSGEQDNRVTKMRMKPIRDLVDSNNRVEGREYGTGSRKGRG